MKLLLGSLLALVLWVQAAPANDIIQNVARSFIIEAPALDKTDGITPETALTPSTFVVWKYPKNKAPVSVTITTAVIASSTLTSDATAPSNNDTVTFTGTLDGTLLTEVYTYKTTLTGAANEVLIGASAAAALDNIKSAINDSGTEGTHYGTGTVASVLVNATTNTDTTQLVVANIPGTLGNSFTTAEASTHLSWTGSTLSGGVDGMLHSNVGYYWFCQPSTFWDTLGDGLLTFNYAAEAAPFFHKYRVVANASNEVMVQGLGSTIDGLLETPLSTVGDSSAWAYKMNNLDITISGIWDVLRSAHLVDGSFGLALGTKDYQTTIATLSTQTSWTLTAGSTDNDAYNGWLAVVTDVTTHEQRAVGVVDDYTGASKTVTLRTDPAVFTMAVGDYVTLIPDRSLKSTVDNRTVDITTTGEAGVDLSNVNGTLDASEIGSDAITAAKIATDAIGSDEIASSAIGASEIGTDAIGASELATDAIGSDEIAASAIGASEIATDAIGSDELAASAIGASELATDAIGDAEIATGAIASTAFAAGAIDAAAIAADAIGASELAADAIGASEIAANAIAEGEIADGAINAATFAAGAIDAAAIAADAIGASEIGTDAIGAAELAADAIGSSELAATAVTEIQSGLALTADLASEDEIADAIWDEALSGHVTSGTAGATLSAASSAGDPWSTALPGAYGSGTAGYIVGTNLDALISSRLAPTTSGRTLDVTTTGEAGLDFSNIAGTLDASEIGADAITSAKIANDAIGATELADDTITAAKIATDAIGAAEIATSAIGSAEIAADAIGASELAADAIGDSEIATGAIAATAFAADAIDAAAIAADAIGASELAADAIASSELATTAVTEIQTGLLTVPKNVAYSNFTFAMYVAATGVKSTGLTPVCTISKDGAAFSACAGTPVEIGATGIYKINLSQAEMNADEIWVTFTGTLAKDVDFKMRTLK